MDGFVQRGDVRPRDALGRLQPRRIMTDPLVLARALPGLGGVFDREVPESHRTGDGVRCVCGHETALPEPVITACEGGCGRRFWLTGEKVLCANVGGGDA